MSDLLNRVRDIGIIPVIKLNSVEQAVPLAKALIDGGIPAAEVEIFRGFEGILQCRCESSVRCLWRRVD